MIIRDNYTVINTREELKRAVELGLTVYFSAKENRPDSGYIEPLRDVTLYFPGAPGDFDMFRWRVLGEHDLSPAEEPRPSEDTMGKYTPITTHAQLVEALRLGLTVEINTKANESAADYQAPHGGGWVGGLSAVTVAADDPNSYAWQGFAFRAVGEHDLSPAKPEPPALTNADFNPGDIVRYKGKDWRVQGIDDGDPAGLLLLDVAEPKDAHYFVDPAFPVTRGTGRRPWDGSGRRWCWARAEDAELVSRGESEAPDSDPAEGVGAVGEHDLSPAKPEPKPLTNADLNPGDIVRYKGKEWRVQGIDDNDPYVGLLLLDVAEPKVSPDFVDDAYPVTRGSGRRPGNGTGHRWCWGHAKKAELVSRGEPEAGPAEPDQWQQDMLGAVARGERQIAEAPPAFHISVTIQADTPEGYAAAIETLARGIEL